MRSVVGYEGRYSVTKDGRIWSHNRNKFMSAHSIYSGYLKVNLRDPSKGSKTFSALVHRVVAMAYLPNPQSKPEVHHKNARRDDNRLENLSWVTREENNQAAWDSGNKKFVYTEKFVRSVKRNIKVCNSKKKRKVGV